MPDIIDRFFEAYWKPGIKYVYNHSVPVEMMASTVDKNGWYEWKLIPGTLTDEDYKKVASRFNAVFPDKFIEWHKRYYFADVSSSIIRLPSSMPSDPLKDIIKNLDWDLAEEIIPLGYIPFGDDGNDTGPLVFDINNASNSIDFPIRVFDHEYSGENEGLSEIIFSSFEKLLECLTHYFIETNTRKSFEVIPEFYRIDPQGAGSTGIEYWEIWIEMQKSNFELYGN